MTKEITFEEVPSVIIRFAGDSGDGIQLAGGRFTLAAAHAGNDLATFPDFPAEIRAPAGSLAGVSAFQIQLGDRRVYTAGDDMTLRVWDLDTGRLGSHSPTVQRES